MIWSQMSLQPHKSYNWGTPEGNGNIINHTKGCRNALFIHGGICIYFMQIPAVYLFCRKSMNKINEKSRRKEMDIR